MWISCNNSACLDTWMACARNWKKPTKSNPSGNSLEVFVCPHGNERCSLVHIRDSKYPIGQGPILDYRRSVWSGGLAVIFQPVHVYDIPADYPTAGYESDQWWKVEHNKAVLFFTEAERMAFLKDVVAKELVNA